MSDLDVVREDVADLAAQMKGLGAQVAEQRAVLDELTAAPAHDQSVLAQLASGISAGQDGTPAEFILRLTGEAHHAELASLASWVADLLVPIYVREPGPQAPWCPRWWEHAEAVARLHALWLAWRELTDPAAGRTGPSVWHREHLDPALVTLRAADGPFAGCMTNPGRPVHRASQPPPVEPCPVSC